MTFLFGKLVWAVLQPGNLLLLCLLAGVLLLLLTRWRRGRSLAILAAVGFFLVAVLPIGPALLLTLEERFPRPHALPDKIDGILVLGGSVSPRLSQAYGETVFGDGFSRVLTGIKLARRYSEARLAILGGEGEIFPVGFSEARATLGFLLDEGITRSRIVLEERSRSTHENAVFAKELLHPGPGQTWAARHFRLPHAAGGGVFPRRRLDGHPLPDRFPDRSRDRTAAEFQPRPTGLAR